nr:zinc finger protein GIS2-like [Tanacetum cinerariifolium]
MTGGGFLCNAWFCALMPFFLGCPSVELSVAGRGEAGKGGSCVLIPNLAVMAKVGASGSGVLLLLIAERIWEYCSRNPLRCCITSEMEETFMEGDGSSQRSSCHYVAFPAREKWKNLNLDELGRECSCKVLGGVGSLALVLLEENASSSKRRRRKKLDVRSSLDIYPKFYNSLGRAPNRCSTSIGKTRRVVIVHLRNSSVMERSGGRGVTVVEERCGGGGVTVGMERCLAVKMTKIWPDRLSFEDRRMLFLGDEEDLKRKEQRIEWLQFVKGSTCHIQNNDFFKFNMSRDRSRSPGLAKRFRSRDRASYRDAPYKRDRPAYRQDYLCNKCRRPGHFARDCPNATVCNNCGLPGHLAAECTSTTMCWNCKESGHLSSECPNDAVCHMCGKVGHLARDCHSPSVSSYDARLCNNCYKPGHIAADCTNDKACKNCRKTGHLARECNNDPVCNICSISGHVARQCPKSDLSSPPRHVKSRPSSFLGAVGPSLREDPFQDMVCRNCGRPGHISRDCVPMIIICSNCGGRGHLEIECPSARMYDPFAR